MVLAVPTPPCSPPALRAGAGADRIPTGAGRRGRSATARSPKPASGRLREVAAAAEIEDDRGRHDGTRRWAGRTSPGGPTGKPRRAFLEPGHHPVGGGEAVGAAAREADGVDVLDQVVRREGVGLPRARDRRRGRRRRASPRPVRTPPSYRSANRARCVDGARPGYPATSVIEPRGSSPGVGVIGPRLGVGHLRKFYGARRARTSPTCPTRSCHRVRDGRQARGRRGRAGRLGRGDRTRCDRPALASRRADSVRFGERSVICFPPNALFNEQYIHIGDGHDVRAADDVVGRDGARARDGVGHR